MAPLDRLASETGEYLAVLVAWILVGGPVGAAVSTLARAFEIPLPISRMEFGLLTGAVLVAVLEVADERPDPAVSLGFSLTYLFAQVPVLIVTFLLPSVPAGGPLAAVVPLAVAYVLAVRWGVRGTAHRVESILGRVAKTPPQRD
jgi:hypothetical protein